MDHDEVDPESIHPARDPADGEVDVDAGAAAVPPDGVEVVRDARPERGVPLLIEVARTNRSPKVREQAIFWLGQSGDPRALEFFEEVLTR